MAYVKLIAPPTTEPITLAEAKLNLRVDFTDDDARITRHIVEAREWVEWRIQQKIAVATWEIALDAFPTSEIELTLSPVNSVTSVKYDDVANVEQTLTVTTQYTYSNGIIYPVGDWPATYDKDNAIRIRAVTGYAAANLIPAAVVGAIYLKIKELYDGTDADRAIHNLLTNHYTMVA
jgi:uncharacterized phiE125 gp8 family phage protein